MLTIVPHNEININIIITIWLFPLSQTYNLFWQNLNPNGWLNWSILAWLLLEGCPFRITAWWSASTLVEVYCIVGRITAGVTYLVQVISFSATFIKSLTRRCKYLLIERIISCLSCEIWPNTVDESLHLNLWFFLAQAVGMQSGENFIIFIINQSNYVQIITSTIPFWQLMVPTIRPYSTFEELLHSWLTIKWRHGGLIHNNQLTAKLNPRTIPMPRVSGWSHSRNLDGSRIVFIEFIVKPKHCMKCDWSDAWSLGFFLVSANRWMLSI